MWSEDTAKELIDEGNKSEDKLTKDLATYLGYALDTIAYYKQTVEEMSKEMKNEN